MPDLPQIYVAYFRTRASAQRCAAELSDDYLHRVEQVERPWVLRMAPAGRHPRGSW